MNKTRTYRSTDVKLFRSFFNLTVFGRSRSAAFGHWRRMGTQASVAPCCWGMSVRRVIWRGFAGALAAMVLGLGVTASAAPSATDTLAARWETALQRVGKGECDGAEWTAISQDPAFPQLASAMRSATFINL